MPTKTTKPPSHLVRAFLESRTHEQTEPPPSPDEIRQLLDWHVVRDGELNDQQ